MGSMPIFTVTCWPRSPLFPTILGLLLFLRMKKGLLEWARRTLYSPIGFLQFICLLIHASAIFNGCDPSENELDHLKLEFNSVLYLIAFFGPLGTGWLHESTDSWSMPLFIMLILMIANVVIAWLVSRPVMVDGKYI